MRQQAVELYKQGVAIREIARQLNRPYGTVHYWITKSIPKKDFIDPNEPQTIFVIPDTQVKNGVGLDYIHWIGNYIKHKKPPIIVQIGDWYDMEALSSYDKGKKRAEGKRFINDINAGNKALEVLESYIDYKPRKVFTLGNHCQRIDRYVEENPEFEGLIGTDQLAFNKHGWEVYPFLKPVCISGIYFVHYLANPMSGKPLGGSALSRLNRFGDSFVMGHQQTLDIAYRQTPLSQKHQIGIVAGACYEHDEDYKGYQGNVHFRGCVMLYECKDGSAYAKPVPLDYLKRFYEKTCIQK